MRRAPITPKWGAFRSAKPSSLTTGCLPPHVEQELLGTGSRPRAQPGSRARVHVCLGVQGAVLKEDRDVTDGSSPAIAGPWYRDDVVSASSDPHGPWWVLHVEVPSIGRITAHRPVATEGTQRLATRLAGLPVMGYAYRFGPGGWSGTVGGP